MRSTWWVALLAIGVLVVTTRLSIGDARSKSRTRPPQVKVERGLEVAKEKVEGFGKTPSDAREMALVQAQKKVRDLLQKRYGALDWAPPADRLDPEVLARSGVIKELKEPVKDQRFKDEEMFVAEYGVRLTPEFLAEMSRLLQQETVQGRHLLLARILAGLVAVVLVTAGYLRLEDMTRGYATKLLRLAAAAVLAAVAAGLWWTW